MRMSRQVVHAQKSSSHGAFLTPPSPGLPKTGPYERRHRSDTEGNDMTTDEFIDAVAERGGMPRDEAERATHATLETLAERLTAGEAQDAASQLPKGLKDLLLRSSKPEAERFNLQEFERRVASRGGLSAAEADAAIRAVMATLREALSEGEFDDIMAQLPREFEAVVEPAVR